MQDKIECVCLYVTPDGKQYKTKEEAEKALIEDTYKNILEERLYHIFHEKIFTGDTIDKILNDYYDKELKGFILEKELVEEDFSIKLVVRKLCIRIISEMFNTESKKLTIKGEMYYLYRKLKKVFEDNDN